MLDHDEETEIKYWVPSQDEINAQISEKGWPLFSDIKYDHLESDEEKEKLKTAVNTAKSFLERIKGGTPTAMIMLASPTKDDLNRTGYGCGKTTIAKIIHYANSGVSYVNVLEDEPSGRWMDVRPNGTFYESRKIMAIFDQDDFDLWRQFNGFGNLLVIDDLGREGTLKWEKRDPDMQLQEKQDRYYNIINLCYERGTSLVITSNLTSREMATFLGGASWSRLLQMCPDEYRVNMTGIRDMRPLLAKDGWF